MFFLLTFPSAPVIVDTNTLAQAVLTAVLSYSLILGVIACVRSYCTTTGVISSEIDQLNRLEDTLSHMTSFEESHRYLFPDLLIRLNALKEGRRR